MPKAGRVYEVESIEMSTFENALTWTRLSIFSEEISLMAFFASSRIMNYFCHLSVSLGIKSFWPKIVGLLSRVSIAFSPLGL